MKLKENKETLRLEALIAQAASLSLLASNDDALNRLPGSDRSNILWLLSDLLREADSIISEGSAHV